MTMFDFLPTELLTNYTEFRESLKGCQEIAAQYVFVN
jgi:hypothetical protein